MITYNSTGLGQAKREYIRQLLCSEDPDILMLQETWLLKAHMNLLDEIHDSYMWHAVSGIDDNKVLKGRPYGGTAILYKKSLANAITKVPPNKDHKRLCAVELKCENEKILLMSVYMPEDKRSFYAVSDEFMEVTDQMERMILEQKCKYYVCGGDLNVDFRRNNAHSEWMRLFMERVNIVCNWELPNVVPEDTYITADHTGRSRIDYINCSVNMMDSINNVCVYKCVTNMSGHRPVLLCVEMNSLSYEDVHVPVAQPQENVSWCRATDNNISAYKSTLDNMLKALKLPPVVFCQDLKCTNSDHRDQIQVWSDMLDDLCLASGQKCIPKCRQKKYNKPGWTNEVKPFKDMAKQWYDLWCIHGEPDNGEVFECMKETKRQYYYAIRRLNRRDRYLRHEKMAEAAIDGRSRNFWKEVDRMGNYNSTPPNIDGIKDPRGIADLLGHKYDMLYNCNPSIDCNLNKIEEYIDMNIIESKTEDYIVTEEQVVEAIKHLKLGKSDGQKGVISDYIINSPRRLSLHISLLLTTSRRHGFMPDNMLLSTTASIVKDHTGDRCSSDNYRGISLSSSLAKIHDIIVLMQYSEKLETSEMQYAFKKKHGTTMCTLALKETVKYYISQESDVYTAYVDASKAFDRVRHDMLFLTLIDRGIPPIIIRSLYDMYRRQKIQAVWMGHVSTTFRTQNGIKQGSVISPVLFTIYMDELLKVLEQGGYGCRIGVHYMGALSSADDLSLLCTTLFGLQKMINMCEEFGKKYGIKYNPKKSMCMKMGCNSNGVLPQLRLSGDRIEWVKKVRHLGNIITHDLRETGEISQKRGDLIGRVNKTLVTFRKAPDSVLRPIFNSKCSHLYGCEGWNLADKSVNQFYTTWNKSVRILLQLPYQTHTRFLRYFIQRPHVKDQVFKRFYGLYCTMKKSDNKRLSHLATKMANDGLSIIGKNLKCIRDRYQVSLPELRTCVGAYKLRSKVIEDDQRIVIMVNELRDSLRGDNIIQGFNIDEIQDMIFYLCVD
jgi:exonuclease III